MIADSSDSQMLHGTFTCIWLMSRVNIGKYSIHGASGIIHC